MRRLSIVIGIIASRSAFGQAACTAKGVDRWTVKTSAPLTSTRPKTITIQRLAQLGDPPTAVSGQRGATTLETRYRETVDGFREGQFVRVTGWVRFIKTSPDDCDYHIQITPRIDEAEANTII